MNWVFKCVECDKQQDMTFEEWWDKEPICDDCKQKYPNRAYGIRP